MKIPISASRSWKLHLQTAISQAQFPVEASAASNGWYISDSSSIDPIVYAQLSVSEDAAQDLLVSPEWHALEANMKAGHVFLCEAGCTWLVDDGTRWMPEDMDHWNAFDQAFRAMLKEREIEYQVVPRDVVGLGERVGKVVGSMR